MNTTAISASPGSFNFSGSTSKTESDKPLAQEDQVDLERYMGTWFVIGHTPLLIDKTAQNAFEHYFLAENGDIETTYQFRKDSPEGDVKTIHPVGWVHDKESNAEWRMRFVWPFKSDYVIMEVADDYSTTLVAHPNRKYAWIMSRKPDMSALEYDRMIGRLQREGFDLKSFRKVPHDWSNETRRLQMINRAGKTARIEDY